MSKLIVGFKIIFMFVFLLSVHVEANPMQHCLEIVDVESLESQMDSIMELSSEEQLNTICPKITGFLGCVNDVVKKETGFNIRELADLLKGTDVANSLTLFANVEELFGEICAEGSELREGYMEHIECFDGMDKDLPKKCKEQAAEVYEAFRQLEGETGARSPEIDEPCVTLPYQFGCLGAAVHEECGEEAFEYYKKIIKKIGFIKSGVCSEGLVHTMKTSLLEGVNIPESHKGLYRVILDMKKRRK